MLKMYSLLKMVIFQPAMLVDPGVYILKNLRVMTQVNVNIVSHHSRPKEAPQSIEAFCRQGHV